MTVKNGLLQKLIRTIVTVETFLTGFINVTITFFCKKHFIIIFIIIIIYIIIIIIFIRVFLMDTNNSRDIRGREGTIFYSTVSLPPTQTLICTFACEMIYFSWVVFHVTDTSPWLLKSTSSEVYPNYFLLRSFLRNTASETTVGTLLLIVQHLRYLQDFIQHH